VAKLMQFIFQVLFKNLGVDTKDVKPTQLLKGRAREVEGNLDFSNKDIGIVQQQVVTEHTTGTIVPISQVELQA
jgi:CCR4-NOT transcription complex subunit 1